MNIWTKRCLQAGVVAGGLWVLGAGVASAQDVNHPHPLLTAAISAPVQVSGNAVGLLGHGSATSTPSQPAPATTAPAARSRQSHPDRQPAATGRHHAGARTSRSAVSVPVSAPVTVCGNAIGHARATCNPATPAPARPAGNAAVSAPVNAPVTVCGNGVGVLGHAQAACAPPAGNPPAATSGTLVAVPVNAPITACGNSVGVLGAASAGCSATTPVTPGNPSQPPAGASSEISGDSAHTGPAESQFQAAEATAARPNASVLPFTGSATALLTWLAIGLLLGGLLLARTARRRHAVGGTPAS